MLNLEFSFNSLQLSHLKNKFNICSGPRSSRWGRDAGGGKSRSVDQHSVPGGVQRRGKGPRDGRAGATSIGSFVIDALSALFAAAQLESLYAALIVSIGLNLLQFVIDGYIEPRVAGTAVSVSPFMMLFAVFLWGRRWGIVGASIGVPILIASATVCAGILGPARSLLLGWMGLDADENRRITLWLRTDRCAR
jgi:hypothetical protein